MLPAPSVRPTLRSSAYVVAIVLMATAGIIEQSPWPVLLAGLLTVPACFAAVPCYYIVYGVLAQIPGANPSSSTGYEYQSAPGAKIVSVMTGAQATWFVITAQALGILAFAVAAILNVLLLRAIASRGQNTRAVQPSQPRRPS